MKTTKTVTLASARPAYLNIVFTVIAIGLGITVPKIFHLFGLGTAFLPMFLPVILLGLLTGYRYVIAAAIVTPLLSFAFTGMPPAPIAAHMTIQLAVMGSLVIVFTRNFNLRYFYAIPLAILGERVLSLLAALIIGNEMLTASAIVGSYPGILMLTAVSIVIMKLYDR